MLCRDPAPARAARRGKPHADRSRSSGQACSQPPRLTSLSSLLSPHSSTRATHYFLLPDLQGHTRQTVNASEALIASYYFDAWGREVWPIVGGGLYLRPFGQWGYWRDTASRLYVRARHLLPDQGRWMSRDPIGFGGGDWNVYGYVGARPVGDVDVLGLACDKWELGNHRPEPAGRVDPGIRWNKSTCTASDYARDALINLALWSNPALAVVLGIASSWVLSLRFVRHWATNTGRKLDVDMAEVMRRFPFERDTCTEQARCGARFAEEVLRPQDGLEDLRWIRGEHQVRTGLFTAGTDWGWAIGGRMGYPQALAWTCDGVRFRMIYEWVLTDTFTFNPATKGEHWAPFDRLHCCGLMRDFWVDGHFVRELAWTKGSTEWLRC